MKKLLTKSNYLVGLKCARSLWTAKNQKELLPEIDFSTQYRFDTGNKIGQLAKQYFKNGIDIPEGDFNISLQLSKEYLTKREILFEAGFKFERCYSRADILKPVGVDEWDLIEVKSGTKVKEDNLYDVAFQKYVYEKKGIKIRDCYLMYINNSYEKKSELNLKEFFTLTKINFDVKELTNEIEDKINLMLENIDSKYYDEKRFGAHCQNPKECPFPELDWDFLPENSVFNLYNIRSKKAMEYFNLGILEIKNLTDDFKLNFKQEIQKNCEINNKIHIDKKEIKVFLKKLKYPLYYIDFETYNPVIPLYKKMRPYQRIPFQFSLHIQNEKNSKLEHYEFLAKNKEDPREEFISLIKKYCKNKGSIIVYNQSFEKGVLREITDFLPEYEDWLEKINERFIDLLDVFRNFYYYNPAQNGSCSIKKVLPAIYPQKNHKDLEISEGMGASIEYEKSIWKDVDKKELEKIRKNLLEYCALDTMAMVHIKNELEKISNFNSKGLKKFF